MVLEPTEKLEPPFEEIRSGGLSWSLDSLVALQAVWRGWVDECFSDQTDAYDRVWHDKVAFADVGTGDLLAIDVGPEQPGAVVYLSHDDGEGHGYVLASSLLDLLERWVPLGCPGPDDEHWLPFVPADEGPIEPASPAGRAWIELLGLRADDIGPEPRPPSDDETDALFAAYWAAPSTGAGIRAGIRAIKRCSIERADDVVAMLASPEGPVQETAAKRIGGWSYEPAVRSLAGLVRMGTHNGKLAALNALRELRSAEADALRAELRLELDGGWLDLLDPG